LINNPYFVIIFGEYRVASEKFLDKLIKLICGDNENVVCRIAMSQLVQTMNKTCSECQADRRVLLLDPLCFGRFYLSLLIESSLSLEDIPKDCYKIRLEEIKKVFQGKPVPVPTSDAVIKLRDALRILVTISKDKGLKKRIREPLDSGGLFEVLNDLFVKLPMKTSFVHDSNIFLAILHTSEEPLICMFDLDKRIAYINLKNRVPTLETIGLYVDLLLKDSGLSGRIIDSPLGNQYIQITIPHSFDASILKKINPHVGLAIQDLDDKKILSVRIVEDDAVVLSFSELYALFRKIGGGSNE